MSGFDSQTLAFYDEGADRYVDDYPRDVASHIPSFLDLLVPGGAILELGCGGGVDAAYMVERGFVVDATDGVAAMAAKAETRLKYPVRIMRHHELDENQRYDAVIATAALLHVPTQDLPGVLTRIWSALKPGGWHVATYKAGDAAGRDNHGRYYNYPSAAELDDYYRQGGLWSDLQIEAYMGSGYFSEACPWLKILVQK